MTLRQLLAEYVILLNKHGVNSQEELLFTHEHRRHPEFDELASMARWLKTRLVANPSTSKSLSEENAELRGLVGELSAAFGEVMDCTAWVHNPRELEEYGITPERAIEITDLASKILNK